MFRFILLVSLYLLVSCENDSGIEFIEIPLTVTQQESGKVYVNGWSLAEFKRQNLARSGDVNKSGVLINYLIELDFKEISTSALSSILYELKVADYFVDVSFDGIRLHLFDKKLEGLIEYIPERINRSDFYKALDTQNYNLLVARENKIFFLKTSSAPYSQGKRKFGVE